MPPATDPIHTFLPLTPSAPYVLRAGFPQPQYVVIGEFILLTTKVDDGLLEAQLQGARLGLAEQEWDRGAMVLPWIGILMARKKTLASLALGMALVVGGGAGAFAATAGYSGDVDSGGAIKYFTNARTSSVAVSNYLSTGSGGVTQGLYSCTSFSSIGVTDLSFTVGQSKTYNSASKGVCFRVKMSRTNPADTNGVLPGNGITSVSGTITY